tara:strand:- start:954 stop:2288 length:1335 start_codon:yes stop_codon:yes gene_type:complete
LSEDQLNRLSRIFTFERKLREAQSVVELRYIATNELRPIISYLNAFFGSWTKHNKFKIEAISDIAVVEKTSATTSLMQKIMRQKLKDIRQEIHAFEVGPESLKPAKDEKPLPNHFLWIPCASALKGKQAALLLVRNTAWSDQEIEYLNHLSSAIGHAMGALQKDHTFEKFIKFLKNTFVRFILIAALIGSMFIPISLSTIGTVEVVPQNPYYINSPLAEVVEEVLVENNDEVDFQQPIISFEKTQLQSSYNLALQELAVIETELLQAQQSSFQSKQDKALLAQLKRKIQIAQEKADYQKLLLDESNVLSPTAGVAVIKDKSLISGKPFKVGETIMVVADPDQVLVEIMIPVQDSITIKKGANINVFLDSDPLNVLQAKVAKFSYEPELTPANILAYKVTGKLIENNDKPRIGLRGSAKIFGEKVHLYFYLFRKPIIFMRQSLGI